LTDSGGVTQGTAGGTGQTGGGGQVVALGAERAGGGRRAGLAAGRTGDTVVCGVQVGVVVAVETLRGTAQTGRAGLRAGEAGRARPVVAVVAAKTRAGGETVGTGSGTAGTGPGLPEVATGARSAVA
jgi:hypothetical protein